MEASNYKFIGIFFIRFCLYLKDCHTHLYDYNDDVEIGEILKDAEKEGLKKIICVASQEKDFETLLFLVKKYPSLIIPGFGLHPLFLGSISQNWKMNLVKILEENQNFSIGKIYLL